jgi:small subunit ribosomal protein S17
MARPRKTAEDLVPDEEPLEQVADAEEAVAGDDPDGQPAGEERAPAEPTEQPVAEEPVAEEPVAKTEEGSVAEADETGAHAAAEDAAAADAASEEAPAAPREKRRSTKTKAEKRATRAAKPKRPARSARERTPIVRLPKPERSRGQRKERRGVVVSSAMDKTIVVRVDIVRPDRRYKKVVRRSTKFHAHDERNEANVGDVVRIVETRPLSKTKNWRLAEVIEAAR